MKKIFLYDIKNGRIYTYMHTFQFLKNYLAFFSCWGNLWNKASNQQLCGSLQDTPADTEADPLNLSSLLTMHFLRLYSARSSVSGRRKSCRMDVSIVGNHTHTLTHSQIRKHKTNHLLIGRKVLAAADETNGSRKEMGGEKTPLSWCLLDIQTKQTMLTKVSSYVCWILSSLWKEMSVNWNKSQAPELCLHLKMKDGFCTCDFWTR